MTNSSDWYRDHALLLSRLKETAGPQSADTAPIRPEQQVLAKKVGRFHVERVIASGGMGTVYEAIQEHPHRSVAVKVMKRGVASRSALRRFEYESQILARLRHPGIAQIYEAGTHEDPGAPGEPVPFFAMEYIPGAKPITAYAVKKKLPTRQRLELFAQVCEAVHHGHQKGVIHRDLKPSNILVNPDGHVKIIDFGVARGTDSDMVITTLQTDVGHLIGTLQYMSPEQCAADPDDIDTRCDVYALGVVLYELLSDKLPYDVGSKPLFESTRVIREQQPTRLSTVDATLKGDIETIVLKALEKDRERRYQSATELARDIRRYLAGEAIAARPPSIVYQLRVFARRNKVAFAAVAVVFVILLAASILSTSLYVRAERQRLRAAAAEQDQSRERQRAEANFQKARSAVDEMLTQVADNLPRLPGMPEQLDPPQVQEIKKALLEDALEFYQGFLDERSTDPLVRYETGHAFLRVAQITKAMRQYERAEETFRGASGLLEALSAEFADEPNYRADLARSYRGQAFLLIETDRLEEARAAYTQAIDIQMKLVEDFPEVPRYTRDLVIDQFGWALALGTVGSVVEAEQQHRYGLALLRRLVDDFPSDSRFRNWLGQTSHFLGHRLKGLGRFQESEEACRLASETYATLANEFPKESKYQVLRAHTHCHVGWLLAGAGRFQEAEEAYRTTVALLEEVVADSPIVDSSFDSPPYLLSWAYERLGVLLVDTGRLAEGEEFLAKALALIQEVLHEFPQPVYFRGALAQTYSFLGKTLRITGRFQEAEEAYRQDLRIRLKLVEDHPRRPPYREQLSVSYHNLGVLLADMGSLQEAEDSFRHERTIREGILGELPAEPWTLNGLAWVLATCPHPEFRDPQRAIELAQQAVELGPNGEPYWATLGVAHYRGGNWESAIAALEKRREVGSGGHSFGWFYLAMAHWQLGEEDEAHRWYNQAVEWMEDNKLVDIELHRLRAEAAELLAIEQDTSDEDQEEAPEQDPG